MKRLAVVLAVAGAAGAAAPADYRSQIEDWRRQRQERLQAEGGWLSLAGLFWLEPGDNTFGAGPSNALVLPAGSGPERAGVFHLAEGRVRLRLAPGVAATIGGRAVSADTEIRSDKEPTPDVVALGRLTLHLIERGGRLAIRVKDPQSPARQHFKGLQWFPVDEAWRVSARFVAHDAPRTVAIPTVTGQVEQMKSPGYVVFQHGGRQLRLEPVLESDDAKQLFFIFRDHTSGKETYGGGRFLYTDLPREGGVVLDFNKAYSPPCAFTLFATCPLPPRQNRLGLRVEAGEKHAGGKH